MGQKKYFQFSLFWYFAHLFMQMGTANEYQKFSLMMTETKKRLLFRTTLLEEYQKLLRNIMDSVLQLIIHIQQ